MVAGFLDEKNNENEIFNTKTMKDELLMSDIVVEFLPIVLNLTNTEGDVENLDKSIYTVINSKINWIPLRIRYDKTKQVKRDNKKHGNNVDVIKDLIEYINRPIKLDYFKLLSEDYNVGFESLQTLLKDRKVITKTNTKESKILDFVKTNILTTFSRLYPFLQNNDSNINMIEFNCGIGRDLLKIYLFGVQLQKPNKTFYTGFNNNNLELISNVNGALSRYNNFKTNSKYPNFFPFKFVYEQNYNSIKIDEYKTKYNMLFCFNFFSYQYSFKEIVKMKEIFNHVLKKGSYLFLILYNKTINNVFVNKNVKETLKILNYDVLITLTFSELLKSLNDNSVLFKYMNNKETANFLKDVNNVYNNFENKENLEEMSFCILRN